MFDSLRVLPRRDVADVSLAGDDTVRSLGERFLSSSKGASLKDLHRDVKLVSASSLSSPAGQLLLFSQLSWS